MNITFLIDKSWEEEFWHAESWEAPAKTANAQDEPDAEDPSAPLARNILAMAGNDHEISKASIAKIASFITHKQSALTETHSTRIRRATSQLPRTLYCDHISKAIFFASQGHGTRAGIYKWVHPALLILPTGQVIKVKKVTPKKPADEELRSLYRDHIEKDIALLCDPQLNDTKGLPKAYASMSYYSESWGGQKRCLMMEHFDQALDPFCSELVPPLSCREKLAIIRQMVRGVRALHTHRDTAKQRDPIAHYDIKLKNFLVRTEEKGGRRRFVVALSDFGFHFHTRTAPDEDDIRTWFVQDEHRYPYRPATPPEFLQNSLHGVDFLRAEVWALGCVLLEFFYDMPDPFILIDKAFNRRSLADQRAWLVYQRNTVLAELGRHPEGAPKSFLKVLKRMLELDPIKRISISDAHKALKATRHTKKH